MIILNFYFTGTGGWIEYLENGRTEKQSFNTAESLHLFIKENNIPLTYTGCITCN